MKLIELTEKEFRTFLDSHPLKTFLQTPEMATLKEKSGWKKYYIGIKENDKVVAATMMLSAGNFFGKQVFYAPRGILIDFENKTLLKTFIDELKIFIKKHKGYVFKMDPYYELIERDIDGNIKENGFNHTEILNYLENLGFHKLPKGEQMDWLFALNIEGKTIDELKKEFRPSTRNIINKTLKSNITIRELEYNELNTFKVLTEKTSNRKNFKDRSLTYYQDMYHLFKPLNELKFLIAEINFPEYIKKLESEKEMILTKLNMPIEERANAKKVKEYETSLKSIDKKIEEAKKISSETGDILPLSCAMFMLYGDEIIYLFSGNDEQYMNFNAQYLIQWEMLNYAVNNNYKRYNFYGISNNFDTHDKDYGIYDFKKGFNGYVIKLIGELELPITFHYRIHKILSSIRK